MRNTSMATLFLIAAMVPVSGTALAQGQVQVPSVPALPRITLPQEPAVSVGGYSISSEQVLVLGAGAIGGYIVGRYLFMGHLGPLVTGVAGAYLANIWYGK